MECDLLINKLRDYRIEIKYIGMSIIAMSIVILMTQSSAFQGFQKITEDAINWVANEEGLVGGSISLFLLALVANTLLLVQIPYTIALMNIALVTDSIWKLLLLSIFTGMGAGVGEINSYVIARGLSTSIKSPEDSKLYQWLKKLIVERPRLIPLLTFVCSASVLPDDVVIWPLAVAKYPIKKILFPMFTGKIIHNFFFALIAYYSVRLVNPNDTSVRVDWTIGILVIFFLYITYQIEKSRQNKIDLTLEESSAAD